MRISITLILSFMIVSIAFASQPVPNPALRTGPAPVPGGSINESNDIRYARVPIPGERTDTYDIIQIFPSTDFSQSECCITVDPNDPEHLLAGVNAITNESYPDFYQGYYYSYDRGQTWSGSNTLGGVSSAGDPVVNFDLSGNAFFTYITWSPGYYCWSRKSTNGGEDWLSAVSMPDAGMTDKPWAVVDVSPASVYNGNVYVAWTDFYQYPEPIMFSRSTNGGTSFTSDVKISNSTTTYLSQGVALDVGPNGVLYAAWANYSTSLIENNIGFNVSHDGGATWGTDFNIPGLDIHGIRGYLKSTSIRVNSFPSMAVDRYNGNIYIVWADNRSGDPDILLTKSTDGGSTWSAPVRVNDDPYGNGKDQWFCAVAVDQTSGNVGVVYFDSRNDPSNQYTTVYTAYSTDEGDTWTNIRILDDQFMPQPIPGCAWGYQGDYINIAFADGHMFPMWAMPDDSGLYQAYVGDIPVTQPPHDVTIEITGPPPTLVKVGTDMSWEVEVANNGTEDEVLDVWVSITSDDLPPSHNPYIVRLVKDQLLAAGEVRRGKLHLFIPDNAPISTYTVENIVGDYPDDPYDSDTFTVTTFDY